MRDYWTTEACPFKSIQQPQLTYAIGEWTIVFADRIEYKSNQWFEKFSVAPADTRPAPSTDDSTPRWRPITKWGWDAVVKSLLHIDR